MEKKVSVYTVHAGDNKVSFATKAKATEAICLLRSFGVELKEFDGVEVKDGVKTPVKVNYEVEKRTITL